MPTVYTIEGARRRRRTDLDSAGCKRVRHGRKRGCTIGLCEDSRGRLRFKKGSVRCGG
jgi:hypothetical protein